MKILIRLYSLYGAVLFVVIFLALLPFFIIIIPNPKWHHYTKHLNWIWARSFFFLTFIPVNKEFKSPIDPSRQYILCANHFSYLDIPTLGLTPIYLVFTGKLSLARIPLFGFMFRNLHITIDRSSLKGRYDALRKYSDAIDRGKTISVFPEGGINSKNPPELARFKDGAFKIAIEKEIPIIPVTIPYNWIILPDDDKFLLHWHPCKIVYHDPIETKGLTLEDVNELKDKVYQIIKEELKIQNK